jgi:hypothetical protein
LHVLRELFDELERLRPTTRLIKAIRPHTGRVRKQAR